LLFSMALITVLYSRKIVNDRDELGKSSVNSSSYSSKAETSSR
jgi:hypothetical protein